MRKYIVAVSAVILLSVLAWGQTRVMGEDREVASAGSSNAAIGQAAPAFHLEGLDGKRYSVGGKREKPLILNFWASWCGPCHEEAPDLKRIYEAYKDRIDLYAVNVTKGDGMGGVKGFVKQYGVTFPVLLDKEGKAADLYRILFVPTSFLIDRDGKLREVVHMLPKEQWDAKIERLLK